MEERFSIVMQRLYRVIGIITLFGVIQSHKESSLLHGIQSLLILPSTEEL